jgi:PAS domain S-box
VSNDPRFVAIDALPDLIVYIDRNECFQFSSTAHARWFGCDHESARGQPLSTVVSKATHAVLMIAVRRALAGDRANFTGPLPLYDGRDCPVRIAASPHYDGEGRIAGCFVAIEDQSHHQSTAEEPMTGRTAEEYPRDDATGAAPGPELAQLMRVRALGDMTTALAHELSQPLSATLAYIQGTLRLLRADPAVTPDCISQLENAAEQARRAGDIVRHIRRFARSDRRARCQTDLGRLVRKAAKLLSAETEARGISLSFDLAPDLSKVSVEPVAIEQVVLTLLHNSIEALTNGPSADASASIAESASATRRISISSRSTDDATVEVVVSDTGPGVPDDIAPHLFEPFVTGKPGGVGLGLAICRTILREHGGELWLDRARGSGATFIFSLPARESC